MSYLVVGIAALLKLQVSLGYSVFSFFDVSGTMIVQDRSILVDNVLFTALTNLRAIYVQPLSLNLHFRCVLGAWCLSGSSLRIDKIFCCFALRI